MAIDVFISHHTKSCLHVTEAICNSLESNHVRCWYAPRDVQGLYAREIVKAIYECRIYIVVLNRESSFSEDVLNEMNIAFERLRAGENISVLPFHIAEGEISRDAKYYIGRMHWIDAITPPMEERIRELTALVLDMMGFKSDSSGAGSKLHSTTVLPNYNFIGREEELAVIDSCLKEDRIVFVYGVGGSGKTEIAKRYIHKYASESDAVIFARYESTLQDLITSERYFDIEGFARKKINGESEGDEQFAIRKLAEIKRLSTPNTLIVLDNFDTAGDPLLEDFLAGPYRVLITTRTNFEDLGIPTVYVSALKDDEQHRLFQRFYKRELSPADSEIVGQIIGCVGGHTLTIELLAKLMAGKRIKPAAMLERLKEEGVFGQQKGEVSHGFLKKDTVYAHIKALFRIEDLADEEREILMNLSLLPIEGVSVEQFLRWCELEDCEAVNRLIGRSWILYDEKRDYMSLHPVISDVVRAECGVSFRTCEIMLRNLREQMNDVWNVRKEERTQYGEIAKSLYLKNDSLEFADFDNLQQFMKVFRQLDYIDLWNRVAEDVHRILGDSDSVERAWYYYELGDMELGCMRYEQAVVYLEKAITVFRRVKSGSYELAYAMKHLAHTYHAMYRRRSKSMVFLEKAQKLLKESGEIFGQCIEYFHPQMGSQLYALGLNYFYFEDYENAYVHEMKAYEIFMKLNGELNSDTNAPMNILARIYSKLGRVDEAIEMEHRVIRARKELWGENQFNYFSQYETLAEIYFENHRVEEAVSALRMLLELSEPQADRYADYRDAMQQRLLDYLRAEV